MSFFQQHCAINMSDDACLKKIQKPLKNIQAFLNFVRDLKI